MNKAILKLIKENRQQYLGRIWNWLGQIMLAATLAMLIACMAGGVLILVLADTVGFVR
jgi:hypothetical protein